jgi:hypothetical protein
MRKLCVRPVAAGWGVESDGVRPMTFGSRARAERAAARLAQVLAGRGEAVEISLQLSDEQRPARFVCPPSVARPAPQPAQA